MNIEFCAFNHVRPFGETATGAIARFSVLSRQKSSRQSSAISPVNFLERYQLLPSELQRQNYKGEREKVCDAAGGQLAGIVGKGRFVLSGDVVILSRCGLQVPRFYRAILIAVLCCILKRFNQKAVICLTKKFRIRLRSAFVGTARRF